MNKKLFNLKKILSILLTLVITLLFCIPVTVSAATYESTTPYVRSWLDAINDYTVVDYYTYSTADKAFVKSATLNVKGSGVYHKTLDTVLSNSLLSEDDCVGFDESGRIYLITNKNVLLVFQTAVSSAIVTDNASELLYDNNDFVIGYIDVSGYEILFNNNGNGNNGNGNNSNGNSNNNTNGNNKKLIPEDGKLCLVESSTEHQILYKDGDYLILNNLILSKYETKLFGFTKTSVVYITSKGKLVIYELGARKQYVKASKVKDFTYDSDGFVTGYIKNGKTFSLK